MRTTLLVAMAFAIITVTAPASALEASDTMTSWKRAASAEKSRLVGEVLKSNGSEDGASGVVKCVDAAAEFSGHADLSIRLVVEACAKQAGEPV